MTAPLGTQLHALADRVGLARAYTNAWGDEQQIADETLRALLAALGLSSDTGKSVAAMDDRSWGRTLEPVLVVDRDEPSLCVPVVVVAASKAGPVKWRICTEDGGELAGSVAVDEMPIMERRGDRSRRRLDLPAARIGLGYHRIEVCHGEIRSAATLIVAPPMAFRPDHWDGISRDWAVTAQLYSLRSARNWGIGDFADLVALARSVAARGASAIGLNPLHALFPARPDHISPYSPSSRIFLNPIYLDVMSVPDLSECQAARDMVDEPAFQNRLAAARVNEFVDYREVWELKRSVLEVLYRWFDEHHFRAPPNGMTMTERGRAFQQFRVEMGKALESFSVFEALQEHFREQDTSLAWREWPAPFRDPRSEEVATFTREHSERVRFSAYLQWEADRQLGEAARTMRAAGMCTGLYRDIAVGVDPDGAEAWYDRSFLVADASIGAPPDIYNPMGQDWGLTPLNPVALREQAYQPFIAAVRANMRHAGAIRIDHVIGLKRLWWIPRGSSPSIGTYIAYPFDDLIKIIVLESQRHNCLVVGEDLGTVPQGFREQLQRRGVLSYRLLLFEREAGNGDFLPPSEYPTAAAVAISTHDLATLRGLWRGRDLYWRRRLSLYPTPEEAGSDLSFRAETRDMLVKALVADGALSKADATHLRERVRRRADDDDRLAEAAHRFLARASSQLFLVQLEDLLGMVEQMNLPGTVAEHPNWRRKLGHPVETLSEEERFERLTSVIDETRRAPAAVQLEKSASARSQNYRDNQA